MAAKKVAVRDLEGSVRAAVGEHLGSGGRPGALAELAIQLAVEIMNPTSSEKAPPTAALAKELRATLLELEDLRDRNDAGSELAAHLSTPVGNTKKPRKANARPAGRGSGGAARPAVDAMATPRRRRSP